MRVNKSNFNTRPSTINMVYSAISPIAGMGLFAKQNIPAETVIVEYDGPRIPKAMGKTLLENGNTYIYDLDRKYDIDGSVLYNLGRYVNHSCDPNAMSFIKEEKMFIKSLRLIKKNEEITYDYEYAYSRHEQEPCNCGAPNCVGYIVHRKYHHRFLKRRNK